MRKKVFWGFWAILLIASFPFVCRGGEKPEPITIGYLQALTGMVGRVAGTECAMLAVEEINKAGGIMGRPVKLLVRDTEYRPATALKVIRELHDQYGVKLFFGVTSSPVALALIPYLEQTNSLLITCAVHSTKVTGKNFSRNLFRITDNGGIRSRALARIMRKKHPDVHKWAAIHFDYEYGFNAWENFKSEMTKLDPKFEVTTVRTIPLGMTSGFGAHFNSIIGSGAEGLYECLGQDIGHLKEAKAFGLFAKIKAYATHHQDPTMARALGKDIAHAWWAGSHYLPEAYKNEVSKHFAEAYARRFGEKFALDTISQGAPSYDGMYAYKYAIEKAGKLDVDAVRKGLEGLRFESICGEKWIRAEDHQALFKIEFHHIVPDPGNKWGYRYDEFVFVDTREPDVWPLAVSKGQ